MYYLRHEISCQQSTLYLANYVYVIIALSNFATGCAVDSEHENTEFNSCGDLIDWNLNPAYNLSLVYANGNCSGETDCANPKCRAAVEAVSAWIYYFQCIQYICVFMMIRCDKTSCVNKNTGPYLHVYRNCLFITCFYLLYVPTCIRPQLA